MKKFLQVAFAIAIIAVATSCEEQVTLKEEENIPELAEHLLGMTHEKAKQYLETQRFVLCEVRESSHEYLYTRNFTDKQQTDEADEYLGYATIGTDTIRLVSARHRCNDNISPIGYLDALDAARDCILRGHCSSPGSLSVYFGDTKFAITYPKVVGFADAFPAAAFFLRL